MPLPPVMDSAMDIEENAPAPDQSSRSLLSTRSSPGALASQSSVRSYIPSSGATTASEASIKREREREGRCRDCGVQTHEFRFNPQTQQQTKVPLTVVDEVHSGRCLLCHPFRRPHGRYGGSLRDGGGTSIRSSMRSMYTMSSYGGSVQSGGPSLSSIRDDTDESVSILTQSMASVDVAAIQEALATFDSETADICDIIDAMRRYPNEPRIQEKGCEKLWIQSWEDENSVAIGRVGGITTILDAMRGSRSQHLHQCGCEALQNLSQKEYNRKVIAKNGGISVIIRAMNKHWTVGGVQQCGCNTLSNLAANSDVNKATIRESGGLQAIANTAKNFKHEETVLKAANQALSVMGRSAKKSTEGQPQPKQEPHQGKQKQASQGGVVGLDKYGFPVPR